MRALLLPGMLLHLAGCETKSIPTDSASLGEFVVSPESLDLGTLFVGDTASATVTVTSVGGGDLDLELFVGGAVGWGVDPTSSVLAPGEDSDHTVTLTPADWGDAAGVLTVTDLLGGASIDVLLAAVVQEDADGDMHGSEESGGDDCDDADPTIYLGAEETWYDGIDQDCDGADGSDQDGDGYPIATDCDDGDATVNPDASEIPYDGVDQDCDGEDLADVDEDGWDSPTDCDDADATVNPGAEETWYDGVDQDCDGASDDDQDGDGYDLSEDCDDTDATVYPGAEEVYYDGVDQDCDAADATDQDGDGWESPADCDDTDATVNPDATEDYYDGVDQDCDGADGDDWDGDGYGIADDCDDTDASVYPGAFEADDGLDTDCDGTVESAPTAVASYDTGSLLELCSVLTLDGAASSDPDGDALTYSWELTSAPSSSSLTTADIDAADDVMPYFSADVAGDYTFTLTVSDGGAESLADSVTVTFSERATNTDPVAAAGDDQSAEATSTCTPISYGTSYSCDDCESYDFTLDGTGSSDGDGDDLTYTWLVTRGRSYGTVSSSTGATTTLTMSGVTATYGSATSADATIRLTVTDCMGATSTDDVTVTYTCTGS